MGDEPKIYVYVVCIYVCVRGFCPLVGRLHRPVEAVWDANVGERNGWRCGAGGGRSKADPHTV
ncbi:hypothetical protein HanRHA438_Chr09g0425291 [Helianthus annuus]|nr:hypothetical protein HanRHA438_Chr09g0425291 [Helianthus annuus]